MAGPGPKVMEPTIVATFANLNFKLVKILKQRITKTEARNSTVVTALILI